MNTHLQPTATNLPAIRRWLALCALLVVAMVAIGGVTRLTESGLSIVEWKLVSGIVPPIGDAAWQAEFDAYKTSPQFQQVNRGFALNDFKNIFWLEYLHRLLGRVIGLVIVLGTAYFALRRRFPPRLRNRMLAICALVAAQGTVGWIMVASGLTHEPRVAPLKLALHLLLAFSLFAALLWTRWQVMDDARNAGSHRRALAARILLFLATIQIGFGALVAGLRAGLTYNTYPRMDGEWIPGGLHLLAPWWRNHLESALTVQFQHRMGAILVTACVITFVLRAWNDTPSRRLLIGLFAAVSAQFMLGVATLLSGVNLWLASAHQLVALLLFGLLLRAVYQSPLDANQHLPK